jgi:hypothetical protein
MNRKIKDYVKERIREGYSISQIRDMLVRTGYRITDASRLVTDMLKSKDSKPRKAVIKSLVFGAISFFASFLLLDKIGIFSLSNRVIMAGIIGIHFFLLIFLSLIKKFRYVVFITPLFISSFVLRLSLRNVMSQTESQGGPGFMILIPIWTSIFLFFGLYFLTFLIFAVLHHHTTWFVVGIIVAVLIALVFFYQVYWIRAPEEKIQDIATSAVESQDFKDCDKIGGVRVNERNLCKINAIGDKITEKFCLENIDAEWREPCYAMLALKRSNITFCNLIKDPDFYGTCVTDIAEATNNSSLCSMVEEGYRREMCLNKI